MLKNKKKLRRLERKTPGYAVKTAQSLVLAGALVLGGAGVASAALTAGENWGDQVVTGPAATGNGDSLWRDGKILPGTPNNGDITLNGGTFTVGGAGTGATGTTVGNGNVHVTSGGIDVNGGNLWINQGNLTFENGTSLKITSAHSLIVHGDIKVNGTLAAGSGVAAGVLQGDNTLDFGNNTLTVSGTGTVRAETIIAKSLNLSGTLAGTSGGGSTFNALKTLTATGADSVIDTTAGTILLGDANFGDKALAVQQTGTGTVIIKNLTVGALTLGNAGAGAGAGFSKVTVNGNMNAGTVVINAGTVGDGVLTLGANPSDTTVSMQGEHNTTGVTITQGTLALAGRAEVKDADGEITIGAVGQTLTGNVALNAAVDGKAVITTNTGGDHAIVGGVTVVKDKFGQIEAVAGSTLNIDSVTASNSTASTVGLKLNNAGTGTLVLGKLNLDKVTATLNAGTLEVGHDKITHANSSALKVNANSTLHLTGGDYVHAMGLQATGLVMDGGTLRSDGKLTLTANTAGNTQAINTGAASGVDTFDGNIVANTLHTDSRNAQGVTITAGSVQIMGKGVATGTDIYTTAVAGGTAHSITVTDSNGSLVLGATSVANQGEGAYGGKVNTIVLGAAGSKLQFGHGNFTVGTLVANTNANGSLVFNDDTGYGGDNTLTLGTAPTTAFEVYTAELGEGSFKVNGGTGLKVANGGTATIKITDAANSGSLDKLTLSSAGVSTLTTDGAHAGTYTIGNLTLGNAASAVSISAGTVKTTVLDLNNTTLTSDTLDVSGTGTWIVGDIADTGGSSTVGKFGLANTGMLLIGQNITLGDDSSNNTTFKVGAKTVEHTVAGAAGVGTIGSTGIVTIAGNGNTTVVIGAQNASDTGVRPNVVAQKFIITAADDASSTAGLTLGGDSNGAVGSLTLTGDGSSFTNAKSIVIGSADKGGTLSLGGAALTTGTNTGGIYSGVITVGNGAIGGTLNLLGSTNEITLDNVVLATANTAEINLSGTGKLNIQSGITDATLNSGINLNGANHTLNVGETAGTSTVTNVTDYTVNGVKVTAGTVTMGAANTHNTLTTGTGLVLNGSTVDGAVLTIGGGINTIDKLSIESAKAGRVNLSVGTLNVLSVLDLSRGALNIATGTTLAVDGELTTGTVTYAAAGNAAGTTNIAATATGVTIAANKWTVNNGTAASSITVNGSVGTETLNLEIGSGGIAASDFNVTKGTVNLLGTGGAIALSGASAMLDVDADGTLNVGALATKDDAVVSPNWSAGTVNLNAGNLKVTSGQLIIDKLETTTLGSNITLGAGKSEFNENGTYGTLIIKDSSFGAVTAPGAGNNLTVNRGAVQFGGDALPTDLSASMTRNNARAALVVNRAVDMSEVTATFGSKLQGNVRTANDKSIEFGEKSLTYINFDNTGKAADDFAITTAGNVFVDTGASLQVSKAGGLKNGDTVYLLESEGAAGSIKGMWNADRVNTQSRLLSLNLHTNADRTQILGTTSMADINQTMPGISGGMAGLLVNMVNTVGEDPHSSNAGIRFASRVINRDFLASDAQAAPTIEGAAQMGAVAGVQVSTIGAASVASGAATTRTSFAQPLMDMTKAVAVHQDNDGTLSLDTGLNAGNGMKNGLGVWIMPLYQSNKTWGQKAENFKSGMSSDLGGIALGADYTINDMFRFGAAFNVGGGYGKSSGDFNETENRFNFWGVNLYGGWTMNNFGLSADVGYTSSFNAVEQDLPTSMEMGNLKADVTTSAWTAGLKGEYKFETSVVDIIPHVGVRYMGLTTDSYDVKSGGTVFGVERDFQSIWTFPIGVAFSKTITSDSGWMFKPMVDLTVIPAAGDLDAKSKVSIPGVGGNAEMKMQVVDAITYDGGVGFEVGKDNLSFGLNYNIQASEHRTGHGVFGTLRYEF